MDNQDFQDLFDAEGLYNELQDNLTSFYENFEALGKDLTKRERARRKQMYEDQMQQLEEQLSMLEEIYEVSGDSIGGLGDDFDEVIRGIRNDLKKYQVAYKRAYGEIGKDRDKFFDNMGEAFEELSHKLTTIFTAFKVDKIADSLTETAESFTKNLRDIQNIRGYTNEQLKGLRNELSSYVQIIHNSSGRLSLNDYGEKVAQWVEYGFKDDTAAAIALQQEYMDKTLGVDLSQLSDLVDQMWYSGYDVPGLLEKSTKYLKALKKSSEFQEADIGDILDTLSEGASWVGMEAKDENDYQKMITELEKTYAIASNNGLDTKMLDEIFSGLLDRSNTEIRQQLSGIGVDTNQMYQKLVDRDFAGALETMIETSSDRIMSMDTTDASLISQAMGTNEDLIYQLRAIQMSGGIDWDTTYKELDRIGEGVESLDEEMKTYHVSLIDRLSNWVSSSSLGQTISSVMTDLGMDVSDAALITTSGLQLLELKKLNLKLGGKGIFSKLLGKIRGSGAGSSGAGLLSRMFSSGSGALGGLASGGLATGAGVAGGLLGGLAFIDSGVNLVSSSNAPTWKERNDKLTEGGLGIASVGAGAGTGAIIGSVVPVLGTAIGALVGAGVGGVASLIWGDDWSESLTDIFDGTRDMQKAMDEANKTQEEYSKAFDAKHSAEEELMKAQESGEDQAIRTAEANLKLAEAEERLAAIRNREAAKKVAESLSTAGVQYQKSYADAEYQSKKANDYLDYYDLIGQIQAGIDEGKIVKYRDKNGLLNYKSSDENYQALIDQANSDEMKNVGKEVFGFTDNYSTNDSSLYSAISDYSRNSSDWADKGAEATDNLASANAAMTEAMANMDQMSGQVLEYAESVAKLAGYDSIEDMANADPSSLGWQEKEALGMVTDAYNAVGDKTGISGDVASAGASINNKSIVDMDLKGELDDWYQQIASVYKDRGNNAAQKIEKNELSDWLETKLGVPTSITDAYHTDIGKPDFMKDYEKGVFDDYVKYKTGIDYVPEDNRPALLHKGEAVLTRQEADEWRQTRGIDSSSDEDSIMSKWKNIWSEAFVDSKDKMIKIYTDVIYQASKKAHKKQKRQSWFSELFGFGDSSSSDSYSDGYDMSDYDFSEDIDVDGSFAKGLKYVPYDGFIAELHEGEAVVPKEDNPYVESPSNTKTIGFNNSADVYDNSELIRVVRQGFEAVIKKMDKPVEEKKDTRVVKKTKKPFQSSAIYNI